MKEFLDLFLLFAKIGGTTFGGGFAMLPIIQREIVDRRGWTTEEELMDYFAIGQCTPGLITINTATFIGRKRKGIAGGIIATLGFTVPSFFTILLIAAVLQNFADYPAVQNAFAGIRVCVCILILNAIISLWKKSVSDKPALVIFLAVFLLSILTSASPAILVILSGVCGIIIRQIAESRNIKKTAEEKNSKGSEDAKPERHMEDLEK